MADAPTIRGIVAQLGGTRPVSRELGVPPSTVQSWVKAGRIPSPRLQGVLDLSRRLRAGVTAEDLIAACAAGV